MRNVYLFQVPTKRKEVLIDRTGTAIVKIDDIPVLVITPTTTMQFKDRKAMVLDITDNYVKVVWAVNSLEYYLDWDQVITALCNNLVRHVTHGPQWDRHAESIMRGGRK